MKRWKISGLDRATAEPKTQIVRAPNIAAARQAGFRFRSIDSIVLTEPKAAQKTAAAKCRRVFAALLRENRS
jgi:hypothetical protein